MKLILNSDTDKINIVNVGIINLISVCFKNNYMDLYDDLMQIINDCNFSNITTLFTYDKDLRNELIYTDSIKILSTIYHHLNDLESKNKLNMFMYNSKDDYYKTFIFIISNIFKHFTDK